MFRSVFEAWPLLLLFLGLECGHVGLLSGSSSSWLPSHEGFQRSRKPLSFLLRPHEGADQRSSERSKVTSSSSSLNPCVGGCSTVTDSLKWYTTFLLRPKVLGLTKADISAMITPQLDHLPRLPNGTKGPGYTDAAQFAQGMSTHGSSDAGHGVRPQACQLAYPLPPACNAVGECSDCAEGRCGAGSQSSPHQGNILP